MANKILIKSSQDDDSGAAELYNSGGTAKLHLGELAINTSDGILFAGMEIDADGSGDDPGTAIGAATDVFAQPLVVHTAAQAVGTASTVTFAAENLGAIGAGGTLSGVASTAGSAGNDLTVTGSAVTTGSGTANQTGGDVVITAGAGTGTGTSGDIVFKTALAGGATGNAASNLAVATDFIISAATGHATGTLSATSVLADGVTATTQSAGTNDTKVATTAFVTAAADAATLGLTPKTDCAVATGSFTDTTTAVTNGDATVTCSAQTNIEVGMGVTGTGIPNNTYVLSVAANTLSFEMSEDATAGDPTTITATFTHDLTTNWTYGAGSEGVSSTLTWGTVNTYLKIDGHTLLGSDRVLVKNQGDMSGGNGDPEQDGLYYVSTLGASGTALVLTRVTDMNASLEFPMAFTFVTNGTMGADTSWVASCDTDFTLNSTATGPEFVQFNAPGNMTAGSDITKTGNTLSVTDNFVRNDASDSMGGTLTATGFTTGNSGIIKFMDGDGTHYTTIAAHGTTTTSEAYTLPAADGTSGQLLSTDGNGVMTWASAATGDVTNVTGGLGLTDDANSGDITLDLDLNELVAETIASGDFIPFVDSTDNGTHKESIDDIATLFAGDDLTAVNGVIAVDDSFIQNDTADSMVVTDFGAATALTLDFNQPATAGAEASTGLHVDYDRTVAGSGTAIHQDIGFDLDVNTASLGNGSTAIGMDIDVVGATSGTHSSYGIALTVSGSDVNQGIILNVADGGTDLKLMSSADTADYATITVGASGATAITTIDSDAAIAHLTLTIDGSLIVAANTGIDIGAVVGGLSPVSNISLDGGTF